MANLSGECLCGAVAYEYHGPNGNLVHCHCSECRKWHAAAFRSRITIDSKFFKWTRGENQVQQYAHTENVTKTFCKVCGSGLITIYPKRDHLLGMPVAAAQGEFNAQRAFHIFTANKAAFYTINDQLPQYETLPEEKQLVHEIIQE